MSTESTSDTLLRFDEEYISFPPFGAALQAIDAQLLLYRRAGIAHHLLVLGESGTGKSSLCRLVGQKYPRFDGADRDILPVLVVPIPPHATIASVAEAMLSAIGDPSPAHGSVTAKTTRVVTLCKACNVEMVLFDEAQHIHDRGQQSTHYKVGDWIKSLIDALDIPTVFLGLPRFEYILRVNEQLRRRFSRRLNLALGQSDEKRIEEECFELFEELGACLPIPLTYGSFGREDMGARLHFASDGRVAYVKKLLASALQRASALQDQEIGPETLEHCFTKDIWWEGVGRLNPFNAEFEFRRLDRGGEPFELGQLGRSSRVA